MKKWQVVTHNRNFHVDEIMAIALLHIYFFNNDYEVIRTRDSKVIESHKSNESSFVIDVGFEYDVSKKCFDHHQKDFNQKWENKTPFSSCGLIWKWLKDTKVLHQKMNKEMMQEIENRLIKKIDAHDNGVENWVEGLFLTMYNRNLDDDKMMNKQFDRALTAAIDYYHNLFSFVKNEMRGDKKIKKDLDKYKEEEYVVFSSNMKDAPLVASDDKNKKIIVIPHSKGKWIVRSVPVSRKRNFDCRCPMPKDWRGMNQDKLKELSGLDNLIFVHKSGYMSIIEGTVEDAVKFAKEVILYNKHFS